MRSASVGQQCVDCVGEGARSTRQPRTTFGGRPVTGAVVTWTLVAINVAVFLVAWVRPAIINDLAMLGYSPYTAGGPEHGVAAGEWYRLITSAFVVPGAGLSGLGFVDILFNMWALVFVGPALEGFLGRARFFGVYLLSAVGGAVMYYYLAPPDHLAAGASGAIYGLFGAWFVVSRRLRLDTRGIVVLIAINLPSASTSTAPSPGRPISAGCSPARCSPPPSLTRQPGTAPPSRLPPPWRWWP